MHPDDSLIRNLIGGFVLLFLAMLATCVYVEVYKADAAANAQIQAAQEIRAAIESVFK